jgi:hypothetical protein
VAIGQAPFAHAFQHILKQVARKLAVVGEAPDIVIDVTIHLVGNALRNQPLNDGDHFRDVLRGARKDMRRQNIELLLVLMEGLGIELRDLGGGLALFAGLGDQLILTAIQYLHAHMADVGDVLDVQHLETSVLEEPAQPVGHGESTQVADMDIAVDGGAAGVHLDLARLQRHELLDLAGQSIINP